MSHIYEKLSSIYRSEADIYDSLISPFTANIRYCAYQTSESQSQNLDELLKFASGNDTTAQMIEALIEAQAEKMEEHGRSGHEIQWMSTTIPIRNSKVRMAVMKIVEVENVCVGNQKSDRETAFKMVEGAIKVIVNAIQILKDDLKRDHDYQCYTRQTYTDFHWRKISQSNPNLAAFFYLRFMRLRMSIERLLFVCEDRLSAVECPEQKVMSSRRAQDVANVYGHAIQYCGEILELPPVKQNEALYISSKMTLEGLQALRLLILTNWLQDDDCEKSLALFNQSKSLLKNAIDYFSNQSVTRVITIFDFVSSLKDGLRQAEKGVVLVAISVNVHCSEKVNRISQTDSITKSVDCLAETVRVKTTGVDQDKLSRGLLPDFTCIPFKPLLFDLALDEIRIPSPPTVRPDKKEEEGGGLLSGLVKNLWWGKK
ncbi:hypothetical protein ACOME3_008437 [Neoechinorhynchus agilis]